MTEVTIKGATGGRRGPGSANHCMHGKDAVIEEILDWRPYDYVTDRTILATPSGPVKVLHTIELEPGTAGHHDPLPVRGAEDPAGEGAHGATSARRTGRRCESGFPSLIAQLDAELAARDADRGPEPELAGPRLDGLLSGL